jgi:NAD kinase
VGLIVNPTAGLGSKQSLAAARQVVERLGAREVATGADQLGGAALDAWPGTVSIFQEHTAGGRKQTYALAEWVLGQGVDCLIVVGGDGTLSDVAQVCLQRAAKTPIVGVGAGSTNAGRLVTCDALRAGDLDAELLDCWSATCLEIRLNDQAAGLAFSDVVFGHTVVGTLNGDRVDLDAAERMHGNLVAGKPQGIGTSRTRVRRLSGEAETLVSEGEGVGTVIVGFAEPAFFGKAITGGICLASLCGLPAGCLVCSVPLAQVGVSAESLVRSAPIVSKYVALADSQSILVEGVSTGTALCADGNVLQILQETDRIAISVCSGAVTAVRSRKDLQKA